jgi:hypothetical protein
LWIHISTTIQPAPALAPAADPTSEVCRFAGQA